MITCPFNKGFLVTLLKTNIDFNLARIKALAMIILAMVEARSVKMAVLAGFLSSDASQGARYRRIQRFMAQVQFLPEQLAPLLLSILEIRNDQKLTLILDRTNWKFGRKDLNILFLAVAHEGIAIPLFGNF